MLVSEILASSRTPSRRPSRSNSTYCILPIYVRGPRRARLPAMASPAVSRERLAVIFVARETGRGQLSDSTDPWGTYHSGASIVHLHTSQLLDSSGGSNSAFACRRFGSECLVLRGRPDIR